MLAPALSLYPGHHPDGDGPPFGGNQRPWYGNVPTLVGVTVLLGLIGVLVYLVLRPGTALDATVGPPGPAPPAAGAPHVGPDAGTGRHAPPGAPQAPPEPAAFTASPAPLQLTGTASLVEEVQHDGGLLLIRMAHRAQGRFSVALTGEGAAEAAGAGTIVDVTGDYQGTRAVGLPPGTYRLGVEAAGWWGVTIEHPQASSGIRLPHILAGAGDTASPPFEVPSARSVTMRWTVEADGVRGSGPGRPALHVRVLDASGGTVATFEAHDGAETAVDLDAGVYLLDVATPAGIWRVSLG